MCTIFRTRGWTIQKVLKPFFWFAEREGEQGATVTEDRRQREQMLALSQVFTILPTNNQDLTDNHSFTENINNFLAWHISLNENCCAGSGTSSDGEKSSSCWPGTGVNLRSIAINIIHWLIDLLPDEDGSEPTIKERNTEPNLSDGGSTFRKS